MHITLQGHPLCIVHWLGDEGGRLSQAPVGNEKLQSEQTRESVPRVTISGAHFDSLDPKETLLYPSTASLPVTKARESAVWQASSRLQVDIYPKCPPVENGSH